MKDRVTGGKSGTLSHGGGRNVPVMTAVAKRQIGADFAGSLVRKKQ